MLFCFKKPFEEQDSIALENVQATSQQHKKMSKGQRTQQDLVVPLAEQVSARNMNTTQ